MSPQASFSLTLELESARLAEAQRSLALEPGWPRLPEVDVVVLCHVPGHVLHLVLLPAPRPTPPHTSSTTPLDHTHLQEPPRDISITLLVQPTILQVPLEHEEVQDRTDRNP